MTCSLVVHNNAVIVRCKQILVIFGKFENCYASLMSVETADESIFFVLKIPYANLVIHVTAHIQEYFLGKAGITKVNNYLVQLIVNLFISEHQIERLFPRIVIL